jgi:hypothetical protein
MNQTSNDILNKKKFLIQILIAICISVFFQFVIDPLIYDPYIRQQLMVFPEPPGSIVICSLSMWFFSFSLAFLYYPSNTIINSYLYCALIPLSLLVGIEFTYLFFYDFLHILPLISIFIILWKKRSTIKLKNVAVTSIVLIIWATIARLTEVNYTGVPLFPFGLLAIIIWPLLNITLLYIANFIQSKRVKK